MPARRPPWTRAASRSSVGRANAEVHVARRDSGGVPVVAVHGELDLNGATTLREALIEAIDENPGRHVVVDLAGVETG